MRTFSAFTRDLVRALAAFWLSLSFGIYPAFAAPVVVNCAISDKIQPLLDAAAPGAFVDISLSGKCSENITIYPTIGVHIGGATGARIDQASAGQPLIAVRVGFGSTTSSLRVLWSPTTLSKSLT